MDMEKDKLIDTITQEVLSILTNGTSGFRVEKNALPDALIIGEVSKLCEVDRRKYNFYSVERLDNIDDLARFSKVFVTKLTLTELTDIALGRDDGTVQKVVIGALLLNREVAILKSAFIHRRFATNADRTIYQLYEEYVRRLVNMRVKIIASNDVYEGYAFAAKPDVDLPKNVITEAVAKVLVCNRADSEIKIPHGCIITPSAHDVFNAAGKKIIIE